MCLGTVGVTDIKRINIASIEVSDDRARGIDPAWVEALAAIIDAEGLIQPIAVKVIGERLGRDGAEDELLYRLVAGGHRLAACHALGWECIQAAVYDETFGNTDLIETLENLARRELTPLDRAKHFARFKVGYETKHGPIQRGGDRKSDAAKDQTDTMSVWSFHETIAERTGFTERTIFRYLAVWDGLAPESYDRLCALQSLASNFSQLKKLSEQNHDRQEEALGLIEANRAGTVDEALALIDDIYQPTLAEKRLSTARGAWSRLNQSERLSFLADNEDEVRQYAVRKGWISG